MKTFILGDSRSDFIADINTSMLLEGYPFQVITAKTLQDIQAAAQSHPNAVVIISETLLQDADLSPIQNKKYGYSITPDGNALIQAAGIPSIGLCRTSENLLTSLGNEPLKVVSSPIISQKPTAEAPTAPVPPMPQQSPARTEPPAATAPIPTTQENPPTPAPQAAGTMPGINMSPEMMAQMMAMFQQMQAMGQTPQAPASPLSQTPTDYSQAANAHIESSGGQNTAPVSEPTDMEKTPATESVGSKMKHKKKELQDTQADSEIDEDLLSSALSSKQKTKVVTVYAAKGGVGKTTISTETAVYLALTTNGRRKFRVCIVDYNIDFGDVSTTLELDDGGPNMSYWASEIRELMERGQKPEDINFSRQQMEDCYLQKMEGTGLYALCAPITHEDSMLIKPDELQTMLRNLIANGEFDYIICDTGNNTRDSSVIAIDKSDYVLLVATQDVTTANCNASVLRTLEDAGFSTDKVRLVINNIMPSRETGISVQEVEETFPNYPCVCRIKRTPDIIRANNLSRPLVYKPNHEYTKQIQHIVHFITAGEIQDEPEKKGLFDFLKRK